MKKLIVSLALGFGFCVLLEAAPPVAEAPVTGYGTPTTVSISTSSFTKVPTSQTSGRMGIFIDNPATNSGRMVGIFGDCSSTSIATTVRPLELSAGNNTSYIPIREDVCLWLLSLHTSAESVHYQEIKQ